MHWFSAALWAIDSGHHPSDIVDLAWTIESRLAELDYNMIDETGLRSVLSSDIERFHRHLHSRSLNELKAYALDDVARYVAGSLTANDLWGRLEELCSAVEARPIVRGQSILRTPLNIGYALNAVRLYGRDAINKEQLEAILSEWLNINRVSGSAGVGTKNVKSLFRTVAPAFISSAIQGQGTKKVQLVFG